MEEIMKFKKGDLVRVKTVGGKHLISIVTITLPDDIPYVSIRGYGTIKLKQRVHVPDFNVEKVDCKGLRFLYALHGPFIEEDYS